MMTVKNGRFVKADENEKREWIFFFEGGGWNSVYASSKEEAMELANEKYEDHENLIIDERSFHVPTHEEYKSLLGKFW